MSSHGGIYCNYSEDSKNINTVMGVYMPHAKKIEISEFMISITDKSKFDGLYSIEFYLGEHYRVRTVPKLIEKFGVTYLTIEPFSGDFLGSNEEKAPLLQVRGFSHLGSKMDIMIDAECSLNFYITYHCGGVFG